jgi:hypothetical protein
MFWRLHPLPRRVKSLEAPLTATCSCLMGMVLLAMLCLGRPDVPVFADSAGSGAGVNVERSGEVAALLRLTNSKAYAPEVRAARPAPAKFAGGHAGQPVAQAVLLPRLRRATAAVVGGDGAVLAPGLSANQPRAPPSIAA